MIEKHEMELEAKDKKIEQLEEELKEETIRADEAAFDVAKLEKTVGSRLPTKFVLISKARILMHWKYLKYASKNVLKIDEYASKYA